MALKVADTEEAEFWAKDLALGLQQVMPVWAANFTSNNDEKIGSNQLDYRKVAADIRRLWATASTKGVVTKGAFPTFGQGVIVGLVAKLQGTLPP